MPVTGFLVRYRPPFDTWGVQPEDCLAIIQRVLEDGSVVLWVFGPFDIYQANRVVQGDKPGEWSMPS